MQQNSFRMTVAGDFGVGKSALCMRFCSGQFEVADYNPHTTEETFVKQTTFEDQPVFLEITDQHDDQDYTKLRDQHRPDPDGLLVCFSLVDGESLNLARRFLEWVKGSRYAAWVLVGCKSDLEHTCSGRELAKEFNVQYFETSAKTGKEVEEAFWCCARQAVEHKEKSRKKNRKEEEQKCVIF
jgi:GTPase SAR1 family protein